MGAGDLDPITRPEAWDFALIAGRRTPGVIPQGGIKVERVYKWDKKVGKGTEGATSTFVGRPPAEGKIKLQLWKPGHFRAWSDFVKAIKYDPIKQQSTAVDFYHPGSADLDVNSVIIEKITSIEHVGHQLYEVGFDLFEFSPPPKGSSVATPATSTSKAGAPEDPVAKAETEYQTQVKQRLETLNRDFANLSSP